MLRYPNTCIDKKNEKYECLISKFPPSDIVIFKIISRIPNEYLHSLNLIFK